MVVLACVACTVPNPAVVSGTDSGSGTSGGPTSTATAGATTTAGTSSTGADVGPGPCEPAGTCAPTAPLTWLGPFAILDGPGDMAPSCPAGWGDPVLLAWRDLSVPASTCECACGDPQGASCQAVGLVQSSTNTCNILVKSWQVGSSCKNITAKDGQADYWTAPVPEVGGGSCMPTATTDIPPTTWGSGVVGCTPMDQAGLCDGDGEACVTLPAGDARLCVVAEGDRSCPPAAPYQVREVLYRDVTDDRDCATCTCDPPAGTCSNAIVRLLDASDCGANSIIVGNVPADGSCVQISPGPAQGAKLDTLQASIDATCTASPGKATGEAIPTDPVTLCCL